MAKNCHLKLIGGASSKIAIPNIAQFSMRDLIQTFQRLSKANPYIHIFLSKGRPRFKVMSTLIDDFTFENPFGTNPEKTIVDIDDAMNRYRGSIVAFCRNMSEVWNKENTTLSSMGFKTTHLKFIE
jgi:hypothetical protein